MKLYTGTTPMALRVNVFIAEKNIDLPTQTINVLAGETRTPEFLKKNCLGQVPLLQLDDGSYLPESIAICRYLDTIFPGESLTGETAQQVAQIEMWTRRMELQVCQAISEFAIHTFSFFKDRIEQVPSYADTQLRLQQKRWQWLDEQLSDGRTYICNDQFSLADIAGMSALLITDYAEQAISDNLIHVKRWEVAMRQHKGW